MKKLIVLVVLALCAGCGGISVDTEILTDCVLQCVADQPVIVIDANGDSLTIYPGDYREWLWKDDGTVELKDKR